MFLTVAMWNGVGMPYTGRMMVSYFLSAAGGQLRSDESGGDGRQWGGGGRDGPGPGAAGEIDLISGRHRDTQSEIYQL